MVEIDKGAAFPELLLDLFAGDQSAGAIKQNRENLQRLALQFDAGSVLPQLTTEAIVFKRAKGEAAVGRGRLIVHEMPMRVSVTGMMEAEKASIFSNLPDDADWGGNAWTKWRNRR